MSKDKLTTEELKDIGANLFMIEKGYGSNDEKIGALTVIDLMNEFAHHIYIKKPYVLRSKEQGQKEVIMKFAEYFNENASHYIVLEDVDKYLNTPNKPEEKKETTDAEILELDFYDLCGASSVFMTNEDKIKYYRKRTEAIKDMHEAIQEQQPTKQEEEKPALGKCKEEGCNRDAVIDYNEHEHYVCRSHYDILSNYFDEEF